MISSEEDMAPSRQVLILLFVFWLQFVATSDRFKRELRFPKGGSFAAAVALASLLPKGPTDGLAHVLEFDLGFPFPEKFTIGRRQAWNGFRAKRSLKKEQRKYLLVKMENILNRIGLNGASCTARFQCELRRISAKSSLLEELLLILFSTSQLSDKECEVHDQVCPISLLHVIMHSEQISGFDGLNHNQLI